MSGAPVIVVEHLTVLLALRIRLRYRGVLSVDIHYIDAVPAAMAVAGALGLCARRLEFCMLDIRDERGLMPRMRLPYFDMNEFCGRIAQGEEFRRFVETLPCATPRIRVFLTKQLADMNVHDPYSIYRAMHVIHIARWAAGKAGAAGVTLFLRRRPWMAELDAYAASCGVQAVPTASGNVKRRIKEILFTHKRVLDAIRGFASWQGVKALFRWNKGAFKPPQMAVDYYGHLNLDQPHLNSDLFFWQKSAIDPANILVTFSLPQDPLDAAKMQEIGSKGMNVLAMTTRALRGVDAPLHRHGLWPFKATWSLLRSLFERSAEKRWMRQRMARYYDEYAYWHDVVGRHGIKIFVSWYKYNSTHCAMADALKARGGVMVIYQRSFEEFPCRAMAVACDIEFTFSSSTFAVERDSTSVIPYQVVTGYLGDHRFAVLRQEVKGVREALRRKGASRILAYLDENSLDDARWHTGHGLMRENYAFIFEHLLRDKSLGLVLKPKVPRTLHKRLGPAARLLDEALASGRCIVFQTGALQGSYSSSAAALAADMVIHGHFCAATAGIECALAGVPTVMLDREAWPVSRLYALGPEVVFKDWNGLWQALEDHWRVPGGNPRLGDWSSMIHEFDPFRDGRAAERMGTYLQWLLEGFKAGLPRQTVLADAAERYTKAWGKDKISSINA